MHPPLQYIQNMSFLTRPSRFYVINLRYRFRTCVPSFDIYLCAFYHLYPTPYCAHELMAWENSLDNSLLFLILWKQSIKTLCRITTAIVHWCESYIVSFVPTICKRIYFNLEHDGSAIVNRKWWLEATSLLKDIKELIFMKNLWV